MKKQDRPVPIQYIVKVLFFLWLSISLFVLLIDLITFNRQAEVCQDFSIATGIVTRFNSEIFFTFDRCRILLLDGSNVGKERYKSNLEQYYGSELRR
jgi:hypothetical protein